MSALEIIDHFGDTQVFRDRFSGAISYTGKLDVDGDGSPHCYHPDSSKGLDRLDDAGHPGSWWGVVTDNGKPDGQPIIQGPHDPAPGFLVSCTALARNPHLPESDPNRYFNAEVDRYISVPERLKHLLGHRALVANLLNEKLTWAIVAEIGGDDHIGEGSIATAKDIDINPDCRIGGQPHSVLTIIF